MKFVTVIQDGPLYILRVTGNNSPQNIIFLSLKIDFDLAK